MSKGKERKKKAMWRLINTEAGNFPFCDRKIQLKTETGTVTNLQCITDI